jgi:hypothetical protein
MMSPTPAVRRFDPPSTLMHWTRLAPLLSATSRLDCIWIIDPVPSQWLAGTGPAVPKINFAASVASAGSGLWLDIGFARLAISSAGL